MFGGFLVPSIFAQDLHQPDSIANEALGTNNNLLTSMEATMDPADTEAETDDEAVEDEEDAESDIELIDDSLLGDGLDSCGTDCDYKDICYERCPKERCFDFGGWLEQGFTANGRDPADGFNGVTGMNDQANEYQMNQLWVYAERETEVRGCGWDIGGRIDLVYGTDSEFMQSIDGLEADWDQTGFYQLAIPQFYLDVAYKSLTFTAGHFISPLGWESYMAPDNFFYSRSYTFMYGTAGTYWGGILTWDFSDQAQVFAGLHRGSDQFRDSDGKDALNFIGGASWISEDEDTYMEFAITSEEQGVDNPVTLLSYALSHEICCRTTWVFEYVWGERSYTNDEWYGINQHLLYKINSCWSLGGRLEWFRDNDGGQVGAWREGNPAQGPYKGNFWETTAAIRWTPNEHLIARGEVRWDWYDADQPGGPRPFDNGNKSDQFLYSLDVILVF